MPLDDTHVAGETITAADINALAAQVNDITAGTVLTAADIPFTPAGTIAATDVQAAIEEVATEAGGGGGTLPRLVTIIPALTLDASRVGTWTRTADGSDLGNGYIYNSSNTINDEIVFDVLLDAGTWSLLLIVDKDSNRGIITVGLDDGAGTYSTIATVDLYAGRTPNTEVLTTGITVGSAVNRLLRFKMASKNGSSSGYFCVVQSASFRRTA